MTFRTTLAALAALAFVPAAASAQTRFEVSGGYNFDAEAAMVGAGARIPLSSYPITFAPHVDYHFIEDVTFLQGNFDGLYHFRGGVSFTPYAGAGLAIGYATADGDSETDAGLNLVFGAEFGSRTRLTPYVQARATISDGTGVGVTAGVIF